MRGTSGHVSDIAKANSLMHGDAGYQDIEKRPDAKADVTWYVAMRTGKRKALKQQLMGCNRGIGCEACQVHKRRCRNALSRRWYEITSKTLPHW